MSNGYVRNGNEFHKVTFLAAAGAAAAGVAAASSFFAALAFLGAAACVDGYGIIVKYKSGVWFNGAMSNTFFSAAGFFAALAFLGAAAFSFLGAAACES
jgi:hypothetical protein